MKSNIKNIKIISKIVNQITAFYLEKGVSVFQIHVYKNKVKKEYTISSFGKIEFTEAEFEELKKTLLIHPDEEYSEYWELMGASGDAVDELILVARICDSIIINYDSGTLELILKKKI